MKHVSFSDFLLALNSNLIFIFSYSLDITPIVCTSIPRWNCMEKDGLQ